MQKKAIIWVVIIGITAIFSTVVFVRLGGSSSQKAEIKEAIVLGENVQSEVGIVPIDILRKNAEIGTETVLTEEQAQKIITENNSRYATAFSEDNESLWVMHEKNQITYYTQYSFADLPVYDIKVGGGCLDVQSLSITVEDDTATARGTVYSYSIYIDYDNESGLYSIDFSYWETPYTEFNVEKRDGNWVLDVEEHSSEGEEVPHTDNLKDHYDTLEEALTDAENLNISELNPVK